jgi:hypothetical protein
MTTDTTTTTTTTTTDDSKGMTEEQKRILVSRQSEGGYAVPVFEHIAVSGITIDLACMPAVVVKGDNIVAKGTGERVNTAQCQWAVTARVSFADDTARDAFIAAARKALADGTFPLRVHPNQDGTLAAWYGTCTVGVSPSKGRAALALALTACLPGTVSSADASTLRERITGAAATRTPVDVKSKVDAAVNAAQAATIAALIASGISPEAAPYLARGEALPVGISMLAAPAVKAGNGRK